MTHPLRGSYLKVRRGQQQLHAVEQLTQRFMNDHPITVRTERDPQTGEKVWWVEGKVHSMPRWWSVLLGEGLYDLRSALDHLAWQLVIRAGGAPDKRTEFPIFKDPSKFKNGAHDKMRGMSDAMKAAIRDLQPCFRAKPAAFPLWWLQDLCNTDKHQTLHLIVASCSGGLFNPPLPMSLEGVPIYLGGLEPGTELLRLPPEQMHVDYVPFVGVEIDLPGPIYRRHLPFLFQSLQVETLHIIRRFNTAFF
jgi:hypothetical protein